MDIVSQEKRSEMMSRVGSKNTKPELKVRKVLYDHGYRYGLNKKGLPGQPDIVIPRYRIAVFVHGCFWHGHSCKKGQQLPANNADFWKKKLSNNKTRDMRNKKQLEAMGWTVLTVWECETKNIDQIRQQLICKLPKSQNMDL